MKIKNMILTSVLLAMGFVLHAIVPGFFGMKFDLLLTFMFIAIMINPSIKNTLLAGLLSGILTAMTTTFPGGQLPNMIDKVVTAFIVLALVKVLMNVKSDSVKSGIIGFVGTVSSGMIFLTSALLIVGLPAPLGILVTSIVVPTAIANTVITVIVYKTAVMALGTRKPVLD
ncbi:tryptophan transporter [Fusibacter bizertensis]|uniref:Tryptophan transporter n=1 Tax=Fusibacter bizertensis TaxID=1488331 RepID=A0ABT6NAD2_9FIRM|nr:tryptophan transporter [Fusibacter bizertensis]MDH8677373.1 tryptophan transporter [Fusibacter bizertensis]